MKKGVKKASKLGMSRGLEEKLILLLDMVIQKFLVEDTKDKQVAAERTIKKALEAELEEQERRIRQRENNLRERELDRREAEMDRDEARRKAEEATRRALQRAFVEPTEGEGH